MKWFTHLSTISTKKEEKKQKKKEITTATSNLNSMNNCLDKREQLLDPGVV